MVSSHFGALNLILFARMMAELVIGFLLYPTVFLVSANNQLMNHSTNQWINQSFMYSDNKYLLSAFLCQALKDPRNSSEQDSHMGSLYYIRQQEVVIWSSPA